MLMMKENKKNIYLRAAVMLALMLMATVSAWAQTQYTSVR